ncbi:hypothetical protein FGO68_gene4860 [Halteria grandinella]|uniref:Uncharacterized protein n=1 Tax=Halteria grandinella TaxID=5974 RepID=A0A8J8NJ98_HALGN|nr:hypothetical protein FGO68_gene4860 [Halteria grandinella]
MSKQGTNISHLTSLVPQGAAAAQQDQALLIKFGVQEPKFNLKLATQSTGQKQWDYQEISQPQQPSQPSQPSKEQLQQQMEDDALLEDLEDQKARVEAYKKKLVNITSDVKEAEDVRERLRAHLNLLKLQTVMLMKGMDDKMIEVADVKVDFKAKLSASRVKKPGTTPRKDGSDNSQGNSRAPSQTSLSRKPSGTVPTQQQATVPSGTDLAKKIAESQEKKIQQQRQMQMPPQRPVV